MALLYFIAMMVLLLLGVNLFGLAIGFANNDRLIDGAVPQLGSVHQTTQTATKGRSDLPRVTVQLPVFNERFVIDRLIDACARLEYPSDRLDIQVLDDSTDDTASIAESRVSYWKQRGVRILHLRRSDRHGYKAGALQNGLTFSKADFVAIFDADFVPPPDFLLRVIPEFDRAEVGMVQARWAHLNAEDSLLTRIQAFGLDTHFAVEQRVRNLTGCFINFNGTAGVWRRSCIDDAGGWSADTLAEDLDLSYRAQLRGWKFKYLPNTAAPAELPADMNAFRNQQFRWTKGTTQTALKALGPLWRSDFPTPVKLEGTAHLTAHLAFPMVLILALVHTPMLYLKATTGAPSDAFFTLLGVGFLGFVGFFLAQLFAQRELYADWKQRMKLFPLFMAGSMGLSFSNTRAVIEALVGKQSAFIRTPKVRASGDPIEETDGLTDDRDAKRNPGAAAVESAEATYTSRKLPWVLLVEVALLLYSLAGLFWLILSGNWLALPFQTLLVVGFGLVVGYSLWLPGSRISVEPVAATG